MQVLVPPAAIVQQHVGLAVGSGDFSPAIPARHKPAHSRRTQTLLADPTVRL
jgi:hypothetical protein